MIQLAISGAKGRMGQMILSLTQSEFADRVNVSGSIDMGDDAEKEIKGAQVLIDFSSPSNTLKMAELCAKNKTALVVGTTGLSEDNKTQIQSHSKSIPLLISPNMSLGVNLLFHLTEVATRSLPTAETEVLELHHNQKVDSPSGTAMRMKEIVQSVRKLSEEDVIYGREGIVGKRKPKEIGMHAVRGGDTPGDHTLYLFLEGERIEITHRALSRSVFARGAILSAMYLAGKPPGSYNMKDVLGIGHA